jgi:D-glycero-D-manno-heptose 1,7-bisphosphate phosphatase
MKRPAVFIDRDGTISEEVGYINHPSRLRLFPYSSEAIRMLNDNGWLAILVTNQAGVARGYFSEDLIKQTHERLETALREQSARLDAIYYCAHHPSVGEPPYRLDCDCRKPRPGLIEQAARDFEIDSGGKLDGRRSLRRRRTGPQRRFAIGFCVEWVRARRVGVSKRGVGTPA